MGAGISALPYSTSGCRYVDRVGDNGVNGHIHDTASNVRRPDELPRRCRHLWTRLAGHRRAGCGPDASGLRTSFLQGAGGNPAMNHALGEERILWRSLLTLVLPFVRLVLISNCWLGPEDRGKRKRHRDQQQDRQKSENAETTAHGKSKHNYTNRGQKTRERQAAEPQTCWVAVRRLTTTTAFHRNALQTQRWRRVSSDRSLPASRPSFSGRASAPAGNDRPLPPPEGKFRFSSPGGPCSRAPTGKADREFPAQTGSACAVRAELYLATLSDRLRRRAGNRSKSLLRSVLQERRDSRHAHPCSFRSGMPVECFRRALRPAPARG